MPSALEPIYFSSPAAFGKWLRANHAKETEVLVGFHKRGTDEPTLTWPESVAEALCYGWIDGVRKRVDDTRYTIRFTPRKATSIWSAVNIALVERLIAEGRMQPAGLEAFERRSAAKSVVYSYEQAGDVVFDAATVRTFRKHPEAWAYWETVPPGYRKQMTWRVMSAKKPETKAKRLATLIVACAEGRRL